MGDGEKAMKTSELLVAQDSDSDHCPDCGHRAVDLKVVEHLFEYNDGQNAATLNATLPVFVCKHNDCGLEWINECGEALIEYAIDNYKNNLIPIDELIERSR